LPISLKPLPTALPEAAGLSALAAGPMPGPQRTALRLPAMPAAKSAHLHLPERKRWPRWRIMVVRVLVVLALIGGWQAAASLRLIDPFFWSQPVAILHTLRLFFFEGAAFTDIGYTFEATIFGFLLGTLAGSLIGLSFWWSVNYADVVQPFVICFESIPKLALAPLIILVFGIGLASKVAIAVALTVVVSTLTTYAGVRAVDSDSERLFYSLGASRMQVFLKLVIPSVLPWTISVLRVNIGLALTGAIVGEFISSQYGLGREILYAGQTYDIALVWVAVLVLSAFSFVMYGAVSWLERLLRKGLAP
jgi:NitT/TauT family transport system permease protein